MGKVIVIKGANFSSVAFKKVTLKEETATLEVVSGNVDWGTVSGSGLYEVGSVVEIQAIPNNDYEFVQWNDGDTNPTKSILISDSNPTYIATFKKKDSTSPSTPVLYKVSVKKLIEDENGIFKEFETSEIGYYAQGTEVILSPSVVSTNHTFFEWSDGVTLNVRTITVTNSDVTYIAKFKRVESVKPKYTVSLVADTQGATGSYSLQGNGTFEEGTVTTISAQGSSTLEFVKWSDGITDATRQITVDSDVTYTAMFKTIVVDEKVALVFNVGGNTGGNINAQSGEYSVGDIITIEATPDTGYIFKSWSDGNTENPRQLVVTKDMQTVYTATFETATIPAYKVNVTFTTTGGDSSKIITTGSGEYEEGTEILISAVSNDSTQVFKKWSDGYTGYRREITVGAQDVTYTAEFEYVKPVVKKSLTFNVLNNVGGSIDKQSGEYAVGTTISVTATPETNYIFEGWNDGNKDNPRTIVVSESMVTTYSAVFAVKAKPKHTVDVSFTTTGGDNTGLSVTGAGTYEEGSSVTISTASTDSTQVFKKWSDGNTDNPRTITVGTSDVSYVAEYEYVKPVEKKTLTFSVRDNIGGNLDKTTGDYIVGETISVTATPSKYYKFINWLDGNRDNPRTIIVGQGSDTYTALFQEVIGSIMVFASPNEGGTVTGSGDYHLDEQVTITAIPNNGYNFVQWNDGDTNAIRTVTPEEDVSKVFTAIFELKAVSVVETLVYNTPESHFTHNSKTNWKPSYFGYVLDYNTHYINKELLGIKLDVAVAGNLSIYKYTGTTSPRNITKMSSGSLTKVAEISTTNTGVQTLYFDKPIVFKENEYFVTGIDTEKESTRLLGTYAYGNTLDAKLLFCSNAGYTNNLVKSTSSSLILDLVYNSNATL